MIGLLWVQLAGAANIAPIALDAGPANQLSVEGLGRLDRFEASDPRVRWITPPKKSRRIDYPDPVTGDWVSEGGVMGLDLPAGAYTVSFLLNDHAWAYNPPAGREIGAQVDGERFVAATVPSGSAFFESRWYATHPRPVFREGETGWHRQLAQNAQWYTLTFQAKGGTTELELFGGDLHAVVVAPEQDRATTEVELALIDARRSTWFKTYKNPQRLVRPLPYVTPGPLRLRPGRLSDGPVGLSLIHISEPTRPY